MNNWLTRALDREAFWDSVQGEEMRQGTAIDRSAAAIEGFWGVKFPGATATRRATSSTRRRSRASGYLSGVGAVRKVGKEGIEEVVERKTDDVVAGAHAGTNVLGHLAPDAQKPP